SRGARRGRDLPGVLPGVAARRAALGRGRRGGDRRCGGRPRARAACPPRPPGPPRRRRRRRRRGPGTPVGTAAKARITLAILTVPTFVLRAFGPFTVGARAFGPRPTHVLSLLPAALLAALVVTETVIHDGDLDVDARLVGVAFAGVLLWRKVSVVWVV